MQITKENLNLLPEKERVTDWGQTPFRRFFGAQR